jgi:putative DNA primase/helicase
MSTLYVDETARVRAALSVIPADDYGTWVDMAFALKHGFGDSGFEIWDDWSRTAGNYNEHAARTTWRSVKESGGKTLASLFWLARQHGFDLRRTHYPDRMATALAPSADILEHRAREEARKQSRHAAVAREAQAIWQWARPVGPEHPYLVRKHLEPTRTLRELEAPELHALLGYAPASEEQPLTGRVLLVPFWIGEAISTLELIDEHGRKSSLAGGMKRGGYWIAGPAPTNGEPTAPILIGEGMATVLSAHWATGWVALAALSSGTLPQVAGILRERYPDVELVVLGDIGPGEVKARQAAEESRARLALPVFGDDARIDEKVPTDFNDMAVLSSFARVGDCLREIAFRNVELAIGGLEPTVVTATGGAVDEPKEEMMSGVKENLVNDTEGGSRRRSSKRSVSKQAAAPEPRVVAGAPAEAGHPAAEPSASPPAADSQGAEVTRLASTRCSLWQMYPTKSGLWLSTASAHRCAWECRARMVGRIEDRCSTPSTI